jgi:hypothetical protein
VPDLDAHVLAFVQTHARIETPLAVLPLQQLAQDLGSQPLAQAPQLFRREQPRRDERRTRRVVRHLRPHKRVEPGRAHRPVAAQRLGQTVRP